MSNIADMEVCVSYVEKSTWVYLLVAVGAWLAYVVILLGAADGGSLTEVDFAPLLLVTIGASLLAPAVGRVVVEAVRPSETHRADERDRDIDRRGEYVGGVVLGVAMVAPFVLALTRADHVWLASAMYTGYVLSAVAGSVVKLVAYRRGL